MAADENSSQPRKPASVTLVEVLKILQASVTILTSLSALVVTAGYVTVNSYLGSFTDIHGYNIILSQYITAGFFLWVMMLLFALVFLSLYYLFSYVRKRKETQRTLIGITAIEALERSHFPIRAQFALFVVSALASIILGYFYGNGIYKRIPHYLGGGKPAALVLILESDTDPALLGVSVEQEASHFYRTKQILLLAELKDGLLVQDSETGNVLIVKNELIVGILDDNFVEPLVQSTPVSNDPLAPRETSGNELLSTDEPVITQMP